MLGHYIVWLDQNSTQQKKEKEQEHGKRKHNPKKEPESSGVCA